MRLPVNHSFFSDKSSMRETTAAANSAEKLPRTIFPFRTVRRWRTELFACLLTCLTCPAKKTIAL